MRILLEWGADSSVRNKHYKKQPIDYAVDNEVITLLKGTSTTGLMTSWSLTNIETDFVLPKKAPKKRIPVTVLSGFLGAGTWFNITYSMPYDYTRQDYRVECSAAKSTGYEDRSDREWHERSEHWREVNCTRRWEGRSTLKWLHLLHTARRSIENCSSNRGCALVWLSRNKVIWYYSVYTCAGLY